MKNLILVLFLLMFLSCSGRKWGDPETTVKCTIVYNVYYNNTTVKKHVYTWEGDEDECKYVLGSDRGTNYLKVFSEEKNVYLEKTSAPIEVLSFKKEKKLIKFKKL